jgi:Tol biopolymer transport system component
LTVEQHHEFYSRPDQPVRADVYCEDLESGRVRVLTGNWKTLKMPVWSPNGKGIAFYAFRSKRRDPGNWLWVVDIATSEARPIAGPSKFIGTAAPQRPRWWSKQWAPVWSRDGKMIFFNARYGGDGKFGLVYRVDADGESAPIRLSPGQCLGTTPDGDAICVYNDREVFLLSLKGDRTKTSLVRRPQRYWYPKVSPSGAWLAHHDFSSAILVASLRVTSTGLAIPDVTGPTSSYYWVHAAPPDQHAVVRSRGAMRHTRKSP